MRGAQLLMYETRDVAANWSEDYTARVVNMGFSLGKAAPPVLYHAQRSLRTYVHGGDLVVAGMPDELKWLQTSLGEKHKLIADVLGPDEGQIKDFRP